MAKYPATAAGAEADPIAGAALGAHAAATTGVHGVTDTAALVLTADGRLSDARAPTGPAGGALTGTYPNPTLAAGGGGGDLTAAVILAPATSVRNTIQPTDAAIVPLVVKGAPGQTANLQDWENSAGWVHAAMLTNGSIASYYGMTFPGDAYRGGPSVSGSVDGLLLVGGATSGVRINSYNNSVELWKIANDGVIRQVGPIAARSSTAVGLIVKGAASQSANLQEWQDSAGVVVAHVKAGGSLSSAGQVRANDQAGVYAVLGTLAGYEGYPGLWLTGDVPTVNNAAMLSVAPSLNISAKATGDIVMLSGANERAIVKTTGDLTLPTAGKGVVVKSPDNLTSRRIGIDNTGAVVATTV